MTSCGPICRPASGSTSGSVSFRSYTPPPELRKFVESIWTFSADAGDRGLIDYIPPDISAEIILPTDGKSRAFIRGPKLHLEEITVLSPARYMGARLRPGIASWLFRVAAREMRGSRLLLQDVDAAPVIEAPGLQSFTRALIGLFRQREPVASTGIALRAADIIASRHGRISTDAFAVALGCSTRHLRRQMIADIGMGPKTAARIARIRQAMTLLAVSDQPLAQIAYAAGYADQAHMTREFFALKAPSPARLRHWRESDFVNTSGPARL